ncbi:probable disease resistance protein At5g63020 [Aristolochia californica]|uniref:probable disease resistance protein At5g63020 n=1 Tax=Aristolochia californica TaxID=171875 RepID=UPI0035D7EAC3
MEIFSPVLELGKCLYVPLKRHCCYFFHYEKNVNELKSEAESLCTRRDDTNRQLDEERRSQRLPLQAVEVWKTHVEKVVGDVERLTEQMSTEEHKCLMGWCPNLSWRYRVGKSAAKKMDQVKKLNNVRNELGVALAYDAPPADVVEIRGDPIVPNEVGQTVMEQVMKALEDDNIRSIGIHGMGGIGKTTLVRDINNRMQKESTLFNKVIMVTGSQNPELKTIQDHIAERLGMKLGYSEINLRAHQLLEGLNKQDRILIIFDDVWTELEVVKLGIPSKDEHRCCKIILTTRNRGVCHQMGTDAEFEMKPLLKQDSWVLFESKIGDVISKNPKLRPIGEDIVRECKGSPLAIVTLGSTLAKKEEQYVWQDVLRRLRSSEPTELDSIMSGVISAIKVSYDYLCDEGMKFCFLFCSLFPEDDNINLQDLRVFGIGEGFLRGEGDLLQAKVKLRSYIKSLKDCGLLLDGDYINHVKMHDVVRDTARYIASKEGHGFIEKTRKGLRDWPELENEEHCKQLSLMQNGNIVALPDSPKFPQLRTLFLTHCIGIEHIPNNFFLGMSTLVNLDLFETSLVTLPQSISSLTSLRTLRLGWNISSHITLDLSSLGMLKNLEILILNGMVTIPVELAELTNLKVLDLRHMYLESIPANVLSKLHRLEELYLDYKLHYNGKRNDGTASLIEVASLNCLTVLKVNVSEEELLCQNISSRLSQLQEFKIIFGAHISVSYPIYCNILALHKLPYLVPEWVICLIQKVECLELEWRPDLKNVLQLDTVSTLKHLRISNCSVIQHIANTNEAPLSDYALGRLEVLRLVELPSLEKICQGPLPERFVMNLRVLDIKDCGKLLNALPHDHLQALQSLEELYLQNCDAMTHVASTTEEPSRLERNALEHLVELSIEDMPNLQRISDGPVPEGFMKKLKWLCLRRCGKLTIDFSRDLVHCIETIEHIQLEEIYAVDKIFDLSSYLTLPNPLERLKYLSLTNFKTLTVVFGGPRSTHFFPNLESFTIKNCPELVSIWSFDNNVPSERCHEVGDLCQLSNVVSNSDGPVHLQHSLTPIGSFFQNLRSLYVKDCNNLRYLLPLGLAQQLRNLEWLEVESCERLEKLISYEEEPAGWTMKEEVLPRLRYLDVIDCNNLRYILPLGLAQQLRNLEWLQVESCERLEKLISYEEETTGWTMKEEVLPRMGYLVLRHLPELTNLYSGKSFLQLPSLERIEVAYCSKLKQLSLEPNTSPKLNEIRGGEKWLRGLEQEMNMEMKSHFKPLFRVRASMEEESETEENQE